MGTLGSEKPPERYNPRFIRLLVERIRTAINFLNEQNFPNGLHGSIIKERSLSLSTLGQGEYQLPIVAQAQGYTMTSATLQNVGGFIYFDVNRWGQDCSLYLEITGGALTSDGTQAVFELHGANGMLARITTGEGYNWRRSAKFDPPSSSQTLLLRMRSTVEAKGVGILGARLIIIP